MMNIRKIAFIGGGNMAEAIMRGLLREDVGVGICVAEINTKRQAELTSQFPHVRIVTGAAEAAEWGEVVILAVKPQQAEGVLDLIEPVVTPDKLVISIMAGIPTLKIEADLLPGCRVIRAMPNTSALIGAGATAVSAGRKASSDDLDIARQIFALIGIAVSVEEKLMDAVTGLSGSGPAYVFSFIEALSNAGVKNGLPRDIASQLAAQTVLGAARMVVETREHPALLREKVTSPGGTTIAGLHALEIGSFNGIVMNAVEAACLKSKELAGR
ncbi:MAG: pyrroline-5-carboxylate reductase [Desulfuromonadaceae bacterium]|nr:pyrroline-5-carboxylate reductase [Desulfuromonadaceae bacterium]MDD2855306.1 pyrroline-5-carboxylate reductase [Desulfuromonadaceae bacterium]